MVPNPQSIPRLTLTSRLYDAALALLYPEECAVCGESVEERAGLPACAACWQRTPLFTGAETICWKCGTPSTMSAAGNVAPEAVHCRRCDDEAFTVARSVGAYEGALRAAVLRLKREPRVCERLARLLFEAQKRPPLNQATRLIPVPLHPERRRERGHNQAEVLAHALIRFASLPLDEWSLVRTRHTARHRASMDAQERRETVENGFRVVRPRLVQSERILLLDDVFTTGATASACACALRAAGAQQVYVLTLARVYRTSRDYRMLDKG